MKLLCLLLVPALAAQVEMTPAERKLALDSFEKVWSTINEKHWDPKHLDPVQGGIPWKQIHDELRPKVENAASMNQARGIMSAMLSRLNLSHHGIVPADVYKEVDLGGDSGLSGDGETGIDVRWLDGRVVVTSVVPGSAADKAGVRTGWIVKRIGTLDIEPAIQRFLATRKAAGEHGLYASRIAANRLGGPTGTPKSIVFLDGEDKEVQLEIALAAARGVKARFGFLPPQNVWIESAVLKGETGYVKFNMFLDPARLMPQFEKAVMDCAGCNGFIIDLRGNPGGLGILSTAMAGFFSDKADTKLGTLYQRQVQLKFIVNPRPKTFAGPLAILIDSSSASTSEIMAGGMKDLGRARIFGTRSAGAALPSMFERLPNGDGFQYAMANYISEGGKALEGDGVTPDVEVKLTRESLLAGRDLVLDAALTWIQGTLK